MSNWNYQDCMFYHRPVEWNPDLLANDWNNAVVGTVLWYCNGMWEWLWETGGKSLTSTMIWSMKSESEGRLEVEKAFYKDLA